MDRAVVADRESVSLVLGESQPVNNDSRDGNAEPKPVQVSFSGGRIRKQFKRLPRT